MDQDDLTLFDDHYPSESGAGEDNNGECGGEPEEESRMEIGMEESLAQDEWVVQCAQYSAQEAFQAEQPKQETKEERSLPRREASLRLSPPYVTETLDRWCESTNFSLFRKFPNFYGFSICGGRPYYPYHQHP